MAMCPLLRVQHESRTAKPNTTCKEGRKEGREGKAGKERKGGREEEGGRKREGEREGGTA